jgi:hypothetical protein
MRIGYARVSTTEQNLDLQRDALKRSGCERIIEETASGGKVQRSGLERVQEMLRQGDVLAVWRLDRLGRSLKHMIELMGELEGQMIGFHSETESVDTTRPGRKLVFHIFGENIIKEACPRCVLFHLSLFLVLLLSSGLLVCLNAFRAKSAGLMLDGIPVRL